MSYTVLARKYRSRNFDELVGQEHIARTLKKAIDSKRIAHAYLFCGTRGTGKTSTARILAKALNCEKAKGPTTDPCGQCNSCKAIERGDDIDVLEIDAASNTQVDKTREVIINNTQYMPAHGRFKIYIIDEVHMLSKSSFNALLKTLEEPPEHVKFILATTEPEKVLPTILSRCQRYDFRNIPTREIAEHLKQICKQEKIKADEDALLLVAKAGAGSMRDSLSLLDRLLSVGEKELTVEMIEQLLGLPRAQLIYDLAQSIGEADVKETLNRADKMIAGGLSADTMLASLIDHLRNLLILRTCGTDSKLVEMPGLAMKDLAAQAARFDPVVLSQDIAILEELRRSLRSSSAGRALLDATLVRLALAEQFNQIGDLLGSHDGASAEPALKKKYDENLAPSPLVAEGRGEGDARGVAPRISPDDAKRSAPHPNPLPQGEREEESDDDALPAVGKVWDNNGPSLADLLKQRTADSAKTQAPPAPQQQSNVEPVGVDDLPQVWQRLLDALAARGPSLHSLMVHGKLKSIAEGCAIIQYEKKHETFVKMLDRNGKREIVRDALSQVAGAPLGVTFEVDQTEATVAVVEAPIKPPVRREVVHRAVESPPPAATNSAVRVTSELVESLRSREPLIRSLMDELGATIVKVEPPENLKV